MSKIYNPSESLRKTQIRRVTLKHPPKKQKGKPTVKHCINEITEHRCPKNIKQVSTFYYSPSQKKTAIPTTKGKIRHKKSIINVNYLKEHHLLAGEYASKYDDLKSQYASIRAKNASVIKSLKKHKKNKRDWTDRFAMK